jgi:hypothetical protein
VVALESCLYSLVSCGCACAYTCTSVYTQISCNAHILFFASSSAYAHTFMCTNKESNAYHIHTYICARLRMCALICPHIYIFTCMCGIGSFGNGNVFSVRSRAFPHVRMRTCEHITHIRLRARAARIQYRDFVLYHACAYITWVRIKKHTSTRESRCNFFLLMHCTSAWSLLWNVNLTKVPWGPRMSPRRTPSGSPTILCSSTDSIWSPTWRMQACESNTAAMHRVDSDLQSTALIRKVQEARRYSPIQPCDVKNRILARNQIVLPGSIRIRSQWIQPPDKGNS